MRAFRALMLTVTLVTPITARAEINTVSKVTAHAEGAKTIVVVHGSATPSFTAYRLERPPRVVVDLADGRVANVDGPIDVDTWAVGQIATAQYSDDAARTARVMIGFKRPASYDVRAKGHDVVITITPDERPPADQLAAAAQKTKADAEAAQKRAAEEQKRAADEQKRAVDEQKRAVDERKLADEARRQATEMQQQAQKQVGDAEARRQQIEQQLKAAEAERAQAQKQAAQIQAETQKMQAARAEADRALKAAEAAQKQAEKARVDEEQRLQAVRAARAEEERRAQKQAEAVRAGDEANQRADAARRDAEAARVRAQAAQEELKRVAAERQNEEARLAKLSQSTDELTQRRTEEAKKLAQIKLEEAQRLEAAQTEARRLAEQKTARAEEAQSEAARRAQASEAARMAEERRARAQAEEASRLRAAAEAQKKLDATQSAIAESERRAKKAAEAAEAERARLESMRAESQKMTEAAANARQEAARQRAEVARLTALQEAERARVEAARVEARRAADQQTQAVAEKQKELSQADQQTKDRQAQLASLRVEATELARQREQLARERAEEAKKLAQIKLEEAQRVQSAQAEARKLAEQKTARAEEAQALAARRVETSEAARLAEERRARAQAEEAARLRAAAEAQKKLDAAESAIADTERRAKKAAESAEAERLRLEMMRSESLQLQAVAQKTREEVAQKRAEAARLFAVQEAERARVEAARLEARKVADQRAQEAERAAHASALASASKEKMAAAERDARRIAEQAALESARLEAARKEALALADRRRVEVKKLEAARLEAQQVTAQREEELKQLDGALARREQDLVTARRDFVRLSADVKALDKEKLATQAALQEGTRRRGQLEAERSELEQKIGRARTQLTQIEDTARGTKSQLEGDKSRLEGERAALETRVAKARDELKKLETETRARLAVVPMPAAKEPVRTAAVRDVRFADSDEAERVIVEVAGDPDCSVIKNDGHTAVLRIAGATLPKKLERTLDAAAYQGPVRTVSTYKDPEDTGAVRVVVALADGAAGEPRLVRDSGRLSWEFPRVAQKVESHSYAPEKVGGFGASIPLQTAQATQAMPGATRSLRHHVYTGRRIDLDFKDADIHNILRLLSDVGQVNIVTSDDVKGTVTIRMRDVPWDQALDVILKAKGLGMQREGNLIRVAPASVLEKEIEAEVARAKAAVELKPIETRLVPLSYADGAQLLPRVQDVLSPRGKVSVDARTNMLIVSDVAGNIALAEDLVHNLDTQTPQVLIEARIVEARSTFLREIGIQWGGGGIASTGTGNPTGIVFPSTVGVAGGATDAVTSGAGLLNGQAASPNYVVNLPAAVGTGSGGALGLTLGSVSGNVNINLRLSALENTGNVRIVSAPKITTLDNIEASIEQGVAIPISVVSAAGTNTLFVDAKLNLTVKPHVTNEGSVIMNIAITRNEPDFVNTGARGDPTILKKQAKTEMLVRDGDTAVIGGIYTRNTGLSYNKVPWFADIPILGWLFKSRRENDDRTELLIFITPRIVNRMSTSARR